MVIDYSNYQSDGNGNYTEPGVIVIIVIDPILPGSGQA